MNSFSFYTYFYREWILNTFTYFWCFLELFIEKFIQNINNEHAQDQACPGATFAFCSHGEKLPRQGGLPGVVQRVPRLSMLPQGNEKLMWTVTGVRPCTEAKLTPGWVSCPGVSELPRGNELSRDHVNRPLVMHQIFGTNYRNVKKRRSVKIWGVQTCPPLSFPLPPRPVHMLLGKGRERLIYERSDLIAWRDSYLKDLNSEKTIPIKR